MYKKTIIELKKERNLKDKEIRLLKRKEYKNKDIEYRELNLFYGTVWGIPDRSIPFDNKRKKSEYKNSNRPVLVLETPKEFDDYKPILLAPGTSKIHLSTNYKPVLDIKTNKKKDVTTYFLLYFKWKSVQKNLQKKLYQLTENQINRLNNLLKKG